MVSSWMGEGYAGAQLVGVLRYKPKDGGFDSRWDIWDFLLNWSFLPHYGAGVDSVSNRNECEGPSLGVKKAEG